ncbi:hypothetical protein [Alicyclobacillus contaminans]|uniref:hypothetical protein n=1 Tax=Alicyclobacillus contaminans TaxID=392016 RepID=UPI00040469D9|nr:hypothetical protein [Alicyclobacillus contaminans]
MNIPVGHKYRLTSDNLNIVVEQRADNARKEGAEPGWRPIAYFARMEQAIDFLLERHIKASEAMTLQELANDIHSARTALYEAIRTAGEGLQATLQL